MLAQHDVEKFVLNCSLQTRPDYDPQIAAVQESTTAAVAAIGRVAERMQEINEDTSSVAASVHRQDVATGEISHNATGLPEMLGADGFGAHHAIQGRHSRPNFRMPEVWTFGKLGLQTSIGRLSWRPSLCFGLVSLQSRYAPLLIALVLRRYQNRGLSAQVESVSPPDGGDNQALLTMAVLKLGMRANCPRRA